MSALIATLPRCKFTVTEYHFFIEQGIFKQTAQSSVLPQVKIPVEEIPG